MPWPYHFVDLSDEQLKQRRRLLDSYGQFAQLSVLLLPLIYQLSLGIKLLSRRFATKKGYQPLKENQSPIPPRLREHTPSDSRNIWRRLSWWLDEPIARGWETRWECLLAALWAGWLLFLVIKNTGDDYLHMTKRFGIIAASQLPIHYLLAAKAWSPIQYLTRMSHEELNPYHRLLGRIIVTFFACHATLYLNFFVQKGLLSKRIRDWDVILGICAISSAILLFTTALARIRDYNYRIFFYAHVALASMLLPILYFHVSHLRIYILESAAIFAVIIVQRNVYQTTLSATITRIPKTNLLSVSIPLGKSSISIDNLKAGQHIYFGSPSLVKKLVKNPFTIANTPTRSKNYIRLIVRSLGGPTASLDALASSSQQITITIEGPYGATAHFPDLSSFDRILLVAGGVGATFIMPIYSQLKTSMGQEKLNFVWVVRDLADTSWVDDELVEEDGEDGDRWNEGVHGEAQIYVTGASRASGRSAERGRLLGNREDDDAVGADADGFELQDVGKPRSEGENTRSRSSRVREGRPDLRAVVDDIFEHDPTDRVAVLVCGPANMGTALRKEVGRWVAGGRDVFWHNEQFEW